MSLLLLCNTRYTCLFLIWSKPLKPQHYSAALTPPKQVCHPEVSKTHCPGATGSQHRFFLLKLPGCWCQECQAGWAAWQDPWGAADRNPRGSAKHMSFVKERPCKWGRRDPAIKTTQIWIKPASRKGTHAHPRWGTAPVNVLRLGGSGALTKALLTGTGRPGLAQHLCNK